MIKFFTLITIILILGLGFYFIFISKPKPLENLMVVETKNKLKIIPKNIKMEKIFITTIYDNYQIDPRLKIGWGFSCLVEVDNFKILFDTGADSPTLFGNMEQLNVDLKKIDFVFISHLHNDHTGGLEGIFKIKPDLKVYKPEFFSEPTKITEKIWTTGSLGNSIKEQSLIINSEKGLIVITGCAHPGIVNIVEKVKQTFPEKNIYLVLGGFHLFESSDYELKNIIDKFKKIGVQKVAPCHCSGEKCRELFKEEYQENFIENGVGGIIKI